MLCAWFHCVLELVLSVELLMADDVINKAWVLSESLNKRNHIWCVLFNFEPLVMSVPDSAFELDDSFKDHEAADVDVHWFISATEPVLAIGLLVE